MRRLRNVIIVMAVVAAVFVAQRVIRRSDPGRRGGAGGETPVMVQAAGVRHFADRVQAVGTVTANESVTITSTVSERVAEVLFRDGASVKRGDVLVRLECAEETAELDEAGAALAEAERLLERVTALREKDLVSEQEFDTARSVFDAAAARAAAARARLGDRIISAPFDGVLGIRQVGPGTLVTPGTVITTLDDLSAVRIDFTVPETVLSDIALDQSIEARAAARPDERFAGRVTSVDSRVDPDTRAVALEARIPNPDGRLRTGMLVTVELACRPRDAVAVPERALTAYADKQYVFVVRKDQTAERRPVTLGVRDAGWAEVVEGLAAGETIVVDGAMNLREGGRVRAADAPAGGEPAAPPAPDSR